MASSRDRIATVVVVILPLTWLAAGIANFSAAIYGGTPSVIGVTASFIAVLAWPIAGLAAGRFFESSLFVRFAISFWAVVLCEPIIYWATVEAVPPQGLGYGLLLMLFGVLVFPLYGLTAVLPPWEPVIQAVVVDAAVAQTLIIAPVTCATAWLAFLAGRRLGRITDHESLAMEHEVVVESET